MSTDLLAQWLTALRASERLAVGRECDYGMTPDQADTFDVIGLLAFAAGDDLVSSHPTSGWHCYGTTGSDSEGAYYDRHWALTFATRVGLTEADLTELVRLNDAGYSGIFLAQWIDNTVRRAYVTGGEAPTEG